MTAANANAPHEARKTAKNKRIRLPTPLRGHDKTKKKQTNKQTAERRDDFGVFIASIYAFQGSSHYLPLQLIFYRGYPLIVVLYSDGE